MIQVLRTKPMKSTTKVEGILVQMSNKEWYSITRMQPPRFGWYLRCAPSTSTGKMTFGNEVFIFPTGGTKAEFEVGIKELTDILNGEKEGRQDGPNYLQR
tara:strand:- start:630 stop:929 length:300 start_codon:yes stop_codon:yes gene_type:complete